MALSHGDPVDRDDILPQLESLLLAACLRHDRREPICVLSLDAKPALPLRVEEILIRLGQLLHFHKLGVVRLRKNVEA